MENSEQAELYVHWSHWNFTPAEWRKAAVRFLELKEAIERSEDDDEQIDHDQLGDNFQNCDICEHIGELRDHYADFAENFAHVWAKEAIGKTEVSG